MDLAWTEAGPDRATLKGAPGGAFAVHFKSARAEGRLDRAGCRELGFDGRDWRAT